MKYYFFFYILFTLISCSSPNSTDYLDDRAVILMASSHNQWLKKEYGYESWKPTAKDIKTLDTVFYKAIENGEFDFLKAPKLQSIKRFHRQYVPYINEKGERFIHINAVYKAEDYFDLETNGSKKWKTIYLSIEDGGNCCWQMNVNLETKTYDRVSH